MDKGEIRRVVAARRKEHTDARLAQMSEAVVSRIRDLPEYRDAQTVFAYIDLPGEVRMRDFICSCLEAGKQVAVPKIFSKRRRPGATGTEDRKAEKTMRFYRIETFDDLREGPMHLQEPDPERCLCLDDEENALMIMPGVAFDKKRRRIGYGGGYYDRYLAEHPHHFTAACAFDFQIFDEVPAGPLDIRPKIVITPTHIYSTPADSAAVQ